MAWEPTQEYVLDLKGDLEGRYQARNDRIDGWRAMLRDEVDIQIPEAYRTTTQEIRLGLPRIWVRRTVGVLTSEDFRVKVPTPPDPTDTDVRNAASRERFLSALWGQIERQQHMTLYHDLAHFIAADGQGWLKLVYRPDTWHGMPEIKDLFDERSDVEDLTPDEQREYVRRVSAWKRGAPSPFAIRVPDPTTIFPLWGEFGLDAVIEVSERPWAQAQRMVSKLGGLPQTSDDSNDEPDLVTVVEYWDKFCQKVLVEIKGEWHELPMHKHNYGFVPYFHAPGWSEPSTDPAEQHLSVLTPLEGQISWLYTMLTAKGNRAWRTGYPTYQTDGFVSDLDSEDGSPKPFELEIGKVHPLMPGADKGIFEVPLPSYSDDFEELFGVLAAASESSQMSDAAAGGGAFAGESGYFRSLRAQMSRVPFDQLGESLARSISDCMGRMLELVDLRVKDTLPVRFSEKDVREWITIGPEQIDGYYEVEVVVRSGDPMNQIALENHYMNVWRGGFMPQRTALDRAGVEGPEEMMDELAWEKILASPEVQGWMLEYTLARMGRSPRPTPQPLLGPDGQPMMSAAEGGAALGGRPAGQPSMPGVGQPVQAPANQPGPQQVVVGR
jgi:hypothetical protein